MDHIALLPYRTALIIGRFQPFHRGHLYLLQRALEVADEVVIGLGSVNLNDEKNPISYEARERIVRAVLEHEGLKDRVVKIVPLPDFPSDAEWLSELERSVGKFDVTLGNNDWTNGVLGDAGYAVIKVEEHQRELYEGSKIRRLHSEGVSWHDRTLPYVADLIQAELDATTLR